MISHTFDVYQSQKLRLKCRINPLAGNVYPIRQGGRTQTIKQLLTETGKPTRQRPIQYAAVGGQCSSRLQSLTPLENNERLNHSYNEEQRTDEGKSDSACWLLAPGAWEISNSCLSSTTCHKNPRRWTQLRTHVSVSRATTLMSSREERDMPNKIICKSRPWIKAKALCHFAHTKMCDKHPLSDLCVSMYNDNDS